MHRRDFLKNATCSIVLLLPFLKLPEIEEKKNDNEFEYPIKRTYRYGQKITSVDKETKFSLLYQDMIEKRMIAKQIGKSQLLIEEHKNYINEKYREMNKGDDSEIKKYATS